MAFHPRSLDGGIDEIPLPAPVPGRLWLCGKHLVGPDVEAAMARVGATAVLCLTELHELGDRYPGYVDWLRANAGDRAILHPIPDLHAPVREDMERLVDAVVGRLRAGEVVVAHCGAGIGRAGTFAVAVLLHLGVALDDALAGVRAARPMAGPEAGAQDELVRALAARSRIT